MSSKRAPQLDRRARSDSPRPSSPRESSVLRHRTSRPLIPSPSSTLNIGDIASKEHCWESYDNEYCCPVLDEDKIIEILEDRVPAGGTIIDYHGCDFFPEDWIDFVIVLRAGTTQLYDRLTARDYTGKKLTDNLDGEIFQVVLEEAHDAYKPEIIFEMQNNTHMQFRKNIKAIMRLVRQWYADH